MMFYTTAIVAAALVVLCALYLWRCIRSPLSSVPGPVITRFFPFALWWNELFGNRTLYVHALHLRYGSVVRLGPGELSFTSYDALKEIYGFQGSGYDKTEFYDLFTVFGRRTMFSTIGKVDHAKRRRLLADRYANSNVVKPASLEGIQSSATSFIRRCEKPASIGVDVYPLLHSYAGDCATHHIFHPHGTNSLHNEEDQELIHQVTADNSLASRLLQYRAPVLYKCFSKIVHYVLEERQTPLVDNFVKVSSRQHDPEGFTLVSRLQGKLGRELDGLDLAAECLDHMVAGIDTTGDALCFLMWELSQPSSLKYQVKLREELQKNAGLPFDKLPYLEAVVQEGLRCFPAIPMSLPRKVPKGGRSIEGYVIPENSVVSCQAYSVHRHNADVFPEPNTFNPDRWAVPEGDAERRRHMFAFSHGGRGCIGRHLAVIEMKLLLQGVYSHFTTLPGPSMKPESMRSHDQIISARPYGQKCLLIFQPLNHRA